MNAESLSAITCPSCQSDKLLPTKEHIIICQKCLTGYRLKGEVPDFRLENAISFRRKHSDGQRGVKVVFSVLSGPDKNQSFDLQPGHCVVIGRKIKERFEPDKTVVGRPVLAPDIHLDPANHQVIERFMSKDKAKAAKVKKESPFESQQRVLGSFIRDPDVLLEESSVSRSHAVVYQDETGVNILDLVSKNGTYVNGREVEASRLKNNDVVSLGTATVRVNFY